MNILFIHQNFPGQYLHLAQYAHTLGNNQIIGLGEAENIRRRGTIFGITTLGYPKPGTAGDKTHHYLRNTESETRRGQAVVRSLYNLRSKGFKPDIICAHPGWGEALFLRDVYPDVPIIMFAEFFFHANEADINFDPEFPSSTDWLFSVRLRNTTQLISLPQANICVSPTHWQASRYPWYIRERIMIQHDGIDTDYMRPDETETVTLQPLSPVGNSRVHKVKETIIPVKRTVPLPARGTPFTLSRKDKVITYVARNLEPYRGFHSFIKSLPEVQRLHPDAHILLVGGETPSYSPSLPDGKTYKEKYLQELDGKLNLERIHFLGRIPYQALRALFRISKAHIYLTYPFVLSWSVLEAMSCETPIIASRTAPVEEVMEHNKNALLTNFFDSDELAAHIDRALSHPEEMERLRKNARKTVQSRFELQASLAAQYKLMQDTARGKFPLKK